MLDECASRMSMLIHHLDLLMSSENPRNLRRLSISGTHAFGHRAPLTRVMQFLHVSFPTNAVCDVALVVLQYLISAQGRWMEVQGWRSY